MYRFYRCKNTIYMGRWGENLWFGLNANPVVSEWIRSYVWMCKFAGVLYRSSVVICERTNEQRRKYDELTSKNVEEVEMRIAAIGKWWRTNEDAAVIAYIDYNHKKLEHRRNIACRKSEALNFYEFLFFHSVASIRYFPRLAWKMIEAALDITRITVCRSWSPHCIQKKIKYANRMRTYVLHVWIASE